MDAELLAFVRERDEVAFPEINAAFDADTGTVFRTCRRLARSGDVHAVLPLVYRPGDASTRDGAGNPSEEATVDAIDAADAAVDDSDGADADGDDGGFEWVGDA
jgi:tRNA(Leu) C34 or U34 (ribose-2'-O)-methylase TrmL